MRKVVMKTETKCNLYDRLADNAVISAIVNLI